MSFLEDFQASLEPLPNILQRKYALLRDLDKSLLDIQRQNEQRCEQEIEDYKQGIKSGDIMPGSSLLKFSDEALDEQKHAIRIADEKVALAVQAYDLVDAHIQQLDQYLKKYEELRLERESAAATASPAQNSGGSGKSGKGSDSGRGGRKKTRLGAAASSGTANANPGMDLDIPVDPNEPTYCFCNGYSFGSMVACDNPTCKIEWFHYACVGLNEAPKGKWFCSDCNGVQKRRKGK